MIDIIKLIFNDLASPSQAEQKASDRLRNNCLVNWEQKKRNGTNIEINERRKVSEMPFLNRIQKNLDLCGNWKVFTKSHRTLMMKCKRISTFCGFFSPFNPKVCQIKVSFSVFHFIFVWHFDFSTLWKMGIIQSAKLARVGMKDKWKIILKNFAMSFTLPEWTTIMQFAPLWDNKTEIVKWDYKQCEYERAKYRISI